MAFDRLSLVKLLEMVLAIVIYWLHYNTWEADQFVHLFVITTAFAGFLVVTVGTFLGLVTNNGVSRTVDGLWIVAAIALYITAGVLCIQHFQGWTFNKSTANMGLAKGSLSLVQAVVFFIDGFFTYRR